MKTTYIHLNAVPMEGNGMVQQASGGQGPVYRAVIIPARQQRQSQGKVLDFAACRQALEDKAPAAEQEQPACPHLSRRWSVGLILDLVVSAAVLGLVAAMTAQFFLN